MKLNPDCIRDVMLEIEKRHKVSVDENNNITFDQLSFDDICSSQSNYTKEDIFYTLFNLGQAEYIDVTYLDGDDGIEMCFVNYMTYAGHELLERIRDSKRWRIVKAVLEAARDFSLDAINAAAQGVTTSLIGEVLRRTNL